MATEPNISTLIRFYTVLKQIHEESSDLLISLHFTTRNEFISY